MATIEPRRSRSEPAPPSGDDPVRVMTRHDGEVRVATGLPAVRAALDRGAPCWIDLRDPQPAAVDEVARLLGLHPLIAEDIERRQERPKVALFENAVHVVVFALTFDHEVHVEEVDFVLGQRFLLSVHGPEWQPDDAAAARRGGESGTEHGPDYVLWSLLDAIVDGYFPVLDRLGDELDGIQDEIIRRPTPAMLQQVFRLKRQLLQMRRSVTPARDLLNVLTNRDLALIQPRHLVYFRDVYDHLIRVTDEIDTDRDLVAGAIDAYLSTVNNNLSLIMKRLTGVTVILAGIGAIAGIFGMSEAGAALNAREAPGFWLVTALVVLLAVAAAAVLRRIDWI